MFFGATQGMDRLEKGSHKGNLKAGFLAVGDGKCVDTGKGLFVSTSPFGG
jgi:hypothetical protein